MADTDLTPFPRNAYSRRSVVAGIAGALPAAAIGAAPTLASPDADLIELGQQLEQALVAYFEASCDWAPRLCEAHRKVHERFGQHPWMTDPDSSQRKAVDALFTEAQEANNFDEASDRMEAASEQAMELCERIAEFEAETVEGLRAKALVVLFEMRPISASETNSWQWPEDGGATHSLFRTVARLTGLTAFVDHYEEKFDQVAAEIERDGGDGLDTSADTAA